jgi:hypothetical protein
MLQAITVALNTTFRVAFTAVCLHSVSTTKHLCILLHVAINTNLYNIYLNMAKCVHYSVSVHHINSALAWKVIQM